MLFAKRFINITCVTQQNSTWYVFAYFLNGNRQVFTTDPCFIKRVSCEQHSLTFAVCLRHCQVREITQPVNIKSFIVCPVFCSIANSECSADLAQHFGNEWAEIVITQKYKGILVRTESGVKDHFQCHISEKVKDIHIRMSFICCAYNYSIFFAKFNVKICVSPLPCLIHQRYYYSFFAVLKLFTV